MGADDFGVHARLDNVGVYICKHFIDWTIHNNKTCWTNL